MSNSDNFKFDPKRRQVLQGLAGAGLGASFGGLGIGHAQASSKKVTMGFIYVGPRDDYGYNQAHFEGKSAIATQNRGSRRWIRKTCRKPSRCRKRWKA